MRSLISGEFVDSSVERSSVSSRRPVRLTIGIECDSADRLPGEVIDSRDQSSQH